MTIQTAVRVSSLIAALSLCGCQTLKGIFTSTADNPNVTYGEDAESNIAKGNDALDSKNYAEAQKYFDYVKSKYPYLEAAKVAELRLADTDFERDRFGEARDRYLTFVKIHPTHPRLDYAAFRAALAYYKDIPSDFFLLPPSEEKEQVNVRNTLTAMKDFIRTYPDSTHQAEAKTVLDDVKKRLAEHEWYVAGFYAKRDKWPAVINRLNIIARDFPDIGLDDKVQFALYDAYMELKDEAKAKDALRVLVRKNPESDGAKKAARMLGPQG
ncbi:MAG: competence lipoprotein ComL [Myxococcaceae bacterium]|nr:competence lipoprotein ComL [Myxococcaceae bacterium]